MDAQSQHSNIRGIVFDKDGTLFDYQKTWVVWCDSVLEELSDGNVDLKERLAEVCGFDLKAQKFVVGSVIVNASAEEVNATWASVLPHMTLADVDKVAVKHLDKLPCFPVCDLHAVFGDLRSKGYKLGIATNDYEEGALVQLKDADIGSYFDFVCGFDSGHGAKPGPGMILGFCDTTGLQPDQVAMVGDSTHDLHAGRAAKVGMNVGVLTGPALADDLAALADVVLPDISGLPSALSGGS